MIHWSLGVQTVPGSVHHASVPAPTMHPNNLLPPRPPEVNGINGCVFPPGFPWFRAPTHSSWHIPRWQLSDNMLVWKKISSTQSYCFWVYHVYHRPFHIHAVSFFPLCSLVQLGIQFSRIKGGFVTMIMYKLILCVTIDKRYSGSLFWNGFFKLHHQFKMSDRFLKRITCDVQNCVEFLSLILPFYHVILDAGQDSFCFYMTSWTKCRDVMQFQKRDPVPGCFDDGLRLVQNNGEFTCWLTAISTSLCQLYQLFKQTEFWKTCSWILVRHSQSLIWINSCRFKVVSRLLNGYLVENLLRNELFVWWGGRLII